MNIEEIRRTYGLKRLSPGQAEILRWIDEQGGVEVPWRPPHGLGAGSVHARSRALRNLDQRGIVVRHRNGRPGRKQRTVAVSLVPEWRGMFTKSE